MRQNAYKRNSYNRSKRLKEGMGKNKLDKLDTLIKNFKTAADQTIKAYDDICWFFDMSSHMLQLNDNSSHIQSALDIAYKSLQQIYNYESKQIDIETLLPFSVKEWYMEEYPDDELGEGIDDDVTFEDVYKALANGENVYDYIPGDSVIRERVFTKLAELKKCNYNVIYTMWAKTKRK